MKILTKSLFLAALMLIANSCNNEELKTIETNKNLSYQESLIYAQKLNNELSTFLGDIDLSKQKINESVLVQDFIKNHANETISSLLSLGKNERVAYEGNYSNSNLRIDDLNELELSAIEKSYLIGLYEAASSEDSEKIIEILESFKENINKNPELENLNLIFSFIETNQSNLLAHKQVQRRTPNKSKNCSEAAETGGIIGDVFGMIKGAIAGGLTGTVLGLNPGTGAAGAVVGSVAGGVTGYAEGAILGYLGCKLLQPTELEENEEEDVKTLQKQNS